MKIFLLSCFLLSLFQTSFAQQDSSEKKVTTLQIGLAYQSNSVYLGRKDSVNLPYLMPNIRYTAKSGFYAEGTAMLLATESRLDAFMLDAGFDFEKKNFYAGVAANAYVFSPLSVNVRAEASTSLNAYAGYNLPFVQPGLNAALVFSNNGFDYMAGFSLEHNFTTSNEAFSFTPAFNLNAGTQHFYNEYYQERKYNSGSGKGRGKGKSKSNSGTTVTTAELQETSAFSILDYEFAGTVEYKLKNLAFKFVPKYAVPQSPNKIKMTTANVNGSVSTQTSAEYLSNSFYWSFGVSYNFRLKKHA